MKDNWKVVRELGRWMVDLILGSRGGRVGWVGEDGMGRGFNSSTAHALTHLPRPLENPGMINYMLLSIFFFWFRFLTSYNVVGHQVDHFSLPLPLRNTIKPPQHMIFIKTTQNLMD